MARSYSLAIFLAVIFSCLPTASAVAQRTDPGLRQQRATASSVFNDYTLEVGAARLPLRLESAAQNQISGRVHNDRLTGYYASGSQQVVWVRWRNSRFGAKPIEGYVGRYAASQRAQGGLIEGVAYSLNSLGGGAPQRNARGFRAWQRNAIVPHLPPPASGDPAPATASLPRADGAWWTRGGDSESALVLDITPSGDVAGWIFGDPLLGHYAAEAGTIAFLRLRDETPIQIFQGAAFASPGGVELRGRLYGLNTAGGASPTGNGSEFRAVNRWNFRTYRALGGALCLGVSGDEDGAPLTLQSCAAVDSQQIAPVMMFNNRIVMVVRHSGRCLDVPNESQAWGEAVQQYACHGGANQQILIQGAASGFQLRFAHSGQCMSFDSMTSNAAVRQRPCDEPGARNQFMP